MLELQLGIAEMPEGVDLVTHLQKLFETRRHSLTPAPLAQLKATSTSAKRTLFLEI